MNIGIWLGILEVILALSYSAHTFYTATGKPAKEVVVKVIMGGGATGIGLGMIVIGLLIKYA